MGEPAVRLEEITKRFPGAVALADVTFAIAAGTCHGLCGENGAGKSTLGKILAGIHAPDAGRLFLDGKDVRFGGPRDALAAGVGMVHQELAFCGNLSVAENLCLASLPRRGVLVRRDEMDRRARGMLEEIGAALDVRRPLGELALAQQQLVQIAAAVGSGARIIVFDEPTSSLTEFEAGRLYDLIGRLKRRGVTCVYVSHRMPELFRLCEAVTVLRDGRHVATKSISDVKEADLIQLMIGRPLADYYPEHVALPPGAEVLRVDRLTIPGKVQDVSFSVRAGEVVGLAGLVGAGRSEVARAMFGLERGVRGTVSLFGRPVRITGPRDAIRHAVGLVPEDRQRQGLVLQASCRHNVSLPILSKLARLSWIRRLRERALATQFFDRLRVRAPGIDTVVAGCSGGNQQKIVFAKWLAAESRILILDEPTRGVDVGAKAEMHALIDRLAGQGNAILLISSELPELIALSTRILVLRRGRLVSEVSRAGASQDGLLRLMAGVGEGGRSPASAGSARGGLDAPEGKRPGLNACRGPRLLSAHVIAGGRMTRCTRLTLLLVSGLVAPRSAGAQTEPHAAEAPRILGDLVDVSEAFEQPDQMHYVASRVTRFDASSGEGLLRWDRYLRRPIYAFNKVDMTLLRAEANEFPGTEYERDPALPFEITFVTPRTVRLRFFTRDLPPAARTDTDSLMLAGPVPTDRSWKIEAGDGVVRWRSAYGEVHLVKEPWHIEFYDRAGKLLTRTQVLGDPSSLQPFTPFSFIRRARDMGRSTAASFELQYDEKIFGTGESFTRLNKRGQKMVMYLRDAMGVQNYRQYKAIPFFLSSNGYAMFVHTSAPLTFDFGHDFDQHTVIYTGDEVLDLFVFLGQPKDVLTEYTALTGRSPVPPLWSFGLWMSRITYKAEAEVREVAAKLRQYLIPADVIHLDTGWFETDWRSDYRFSTTRFPNPQGMIADLRKLGFRISVWQYTYFPRKNPIWGELFERGYAVRDEGGRIGPEDATLDVTNPDAVRWYQGKLKSLLDLGVGALKVDFGEGAPLGGVYHAGRTGWYEHNLYPVRYNKAAWEVTKSATGDGVIWARSAWAGSQRYPLHWGGDAENTNSAMAATLRGGLSFGLSGFSFWSHDAGGFVNRAPRDLYRRWIAFGALTSHTRTHGAPPREPWTYDSAFVGDFRRAVELKYRLMPYVYAQAAASSAKGWPMVRALFFEYPDDPTSWTIEDEYLFGRDLLVAPLFDSVPRRRVYLPPGTWIDYQTGRPYEGQRWHEIESGQIPIVMLVRDHAVLPHIDLAQSTATMTWTELELRVFSADDGPASGLVALPGGEAQSVELALTPRGYALVADPLAGKVRWRIARAALTR